jgi:hypothetical protein
MVARAFRSPGPPGYPDRMKIDALGLHSADSVGLGDETCELLLRD